MRENRCGLACISEFPSSVPSDAHCFRSRSGLAAILWSPANIRATGNLAHVGRDFVVAKFDRTYFASVYISPNRETGYYLETLDELRDLCVSLSDRVVILCRGFNARSFSWGDSACNHRGDVLEEWSAELDLRSCNVGDQFTCVRLQGSSIVDLTWVSSRGVNCVSGWHVITGDGDSLRSSIHFLLRGCWITGWSTSSAGQRVSPVVVDQF